jgi:hypothetical protein
MRLLTAYFDKLDAMVNKMTHVFISYRTGSDRQLAPDLKITAAYDSLAYCVRVHAYGGGIQLLWSKSKFHQPR